MALVESFNLLVWEWLTQFGVRTPPPAQEPLMFI